MMKFNGLAWFSTLAWSIYELVGNNKTIAHGTFSKRVRQTVGAAAMSVNQVARGLSTGYSACDVAQ
jgi:uncharacterized protein YjcR